MEKATTTDDGHASGAPLVVVPHEPLAACASLGHGRRSRLWGHCCRSILGESQLLHEGGAVARSHLQGHVAAARAKMWQAQLHWFVIISVPSPSLLDLSFFLWFLKVSIHEYVFF
jgi:hypothetical protein